MPHLAAIQLMRVIKWPRSDSDGSCVNYNVRGNKGLLQYLLIIQTSQSLRVKEIRKLKMNRESKEPEYTYDRRRKVSGKSTK